MEIPERIQNMTDHQLLRAIVKVAEEKGTWKDEGARVRFLEQMKAEETSRGMDGDENA